MATEKYICTVSHDDPRKGGGFKKYIAGREYDLDNPCLRYFEPVKDEPKEQPAPAIKKGGKGK